jgi:DnaJ-class molecular chaperone
MDRISLERGTMRTNEEYERDGWKHERCFVCSGTGMVSDSGGDFNGPKECDSCCGNGAYWITPKGRHVAYPGGPFC